MILIGLGSNLVDERGRSPADTVAAAIEALDRCPGLRLCARSCLWESAPVLGEGAPPDEQPWYVNAVAAIETARPAREVLALLQGIEAGFGRVRAQRWGARVLDLDLIAYHDLVLDDPVPPGLVLPHPRAAGRAFVLLPLAEVAPDWRHPATGTPLRDLLAALDAGQPCRRLEA